MNFRKTEGNSLPEQWIQWGIRLILGIILALILYRDARSRDYSWLVWTITPFAILMTPTIPITILLSGIILAVYFLMRPKGETRPCPHCKRRVFHQLAFCPFCGKSVKKECLSCHETVDWEVTKCPYCRSTHLTES